MKPIKTDTTGVVYKGPTPEIGDLWCERVETGHIRSFWKPTEEELQILNEGGCVGLDIHTEPIPPVAVNVSEKTGLETPFKVNESEPDEKDGAGFSLFVLVQAWNEDLTHQWCMSNLPLISLPLSERTGLRVVSEGMDQILLKYRLRSGLSDESRVTIEALDGVAGIVLKPGDVPIDPAPMDSHGIATT